MSPFIRRYARYLNEKALSYRTVAFDFCKVKRGLVYSLLFCAGNQQRWARSLEKLSQVNIKIVYWKFISDHFSEISNLKLILRHSQDLDLPFKIDLRSPPRSTTLNWSEVTIKITILGSWWPSRQRSCPSLVISHRHHVLAMVRIQLEKCSSTYS